MALRHTHGSHLANYLAMNEVPGAESPICLKHLI